MSINLSEMLELNRTSSRKLSKAMFATAEQYTAYNEAVTALYNAVASLHYRKWTNTASEEQFLVVEATNNAYQELRNVYALTGFTADDGSLVKVHPIANELDCLMTYTTKFVWRYTDEYSSVVRAIRRCDELISWLTDTHGDTSKFDEQKTVLTAEKERLEKTTVYRVSLPEFISKATFISRFEKHLNARIMGEAMKSPEQRKAEAEALKAQRKARKAEKEAEKQNLAKAG